MTGSADMLLTYAGAGAFFAAILINIIRAHLVKPWMRKYIPIPMCLGIPAYLVRGLSSSCLHSALLKYFEQNHNWP